MKDKGSVPVEVHGDTITDYGGKGPPPVTFLCITPPASAKGQPTPNSDCPSLSLVGIQLP